MSIRRVIMDQFEILLNQAKSPVETTGYPLQLAGVSPRWANPINIADEGATPFVSFGYGGTLPAPVGFADAIYKAFSLQVYGIVQESDVDGEHLLQIADRMEALMEHFVAELETFPLTDEDDVQTVEKVELAETQSAGGKFTSFEYLQFRLEFTYNTQRLRVFGNTFETEKRTEV